MYKETLHRLSNKILLLIIVFSAFIFMLTACNTPRKARKPNSCNCPVWSSSNQLNENEPRGI